MAGCWPASGRTPGDLRLRLVPLSPARARMSTLASWVQLGHDDLAEGVAVVVGAHAHGSTRCGVSPSVNTIVRDPRAEVPMTLEHLRHQQLRGLALALRVGSDGGTHLARPDRVLTFAVAAGGAPGGQRRRAPTGGAFQLSVSRSGRLVVSSDPEPGLEPDGQEGELGLDLVPTRSRPGLRAGSGAGSVPPVGRRGPLGHEARRGVCDGRGREERAPSTSSTTYPPRLTSPQWKQ